MTASGVMSFGDIRDLTKGITMLSLKVIQSGTKDYIPMMKTGSSESFKKIRKNGDLSVTLFAKNIQKGAQTIKKFKDGNN